MIIGLCDDNEVQLNYLSSLIDSWAKEGHVECDIHSYHSAEELIFENGENYPFDLLILDIQMGSMNGMELAKKIRAADKKVMLIFVTGLRDYVFEGYEVDALRYLLKPIKEEQFTALLNEAFSRLNKDTKGYYIFSCRGELVKLDYEDIIYIEASGHYVTIVSTNETYELKENISQVYEQLKAEDFFCTHRSFIINLKHVEKINKTDCLMSDGSRVPVSRSNYQSLNEAFIKYYRRG